MPTGYTSILIDTKDPKKYAEACIRAFGVAIEMRDEPLSKPVSDELEDTSSKYHSERIADANARIETVSNMSDEEASAKAEEEYNQRKASLEESIEEKKSVGALFEKTRSLVETFTPPSSEHEGFKKFMLEQLESSKSDGDASFYVEELENLTQLSPQEWKDKEIQSAERDISYHTEELEKSSQRHTDKNEWLTQLRSSLQHFDR